MKKFILLISFVFSAGALAGVLDSGKKYNFLGDDLASACVDGHSEKRGLCLGYIAGVAAMQKKACVPSGAKFGQVKYAVESYMEENKAGNSKHAFKVVVIALKDNWPCK